ncbi:imidazole glycerol phosphate synthase subunit HisH [Natranaerobius thermophilus]|uniref:Imidazole glycerol phosphate synthase subunit HisH n=1 Tax=Natranaerobius thermophilus (strain ATCC BAA-1301 / DSM 18059 / JW/NM-WN-LF) TaxID=457570 RepID=B2A6X2_NATTJ|nr:imidazole glycerol phosphate synthase subunit HisH [Natranaerobius thermophilus]ACB85566.1 imidazole glycerol phosphate synthase, glutamine amidotransferase subunit [Natranaerobius thermophilus JW/NM-WN-LF]
MIGIIDYGVGNLFSVKNALDYLEINSEITDSPEKLTNYSALILPGVGSFKEGMSMLKEQGFQDIIRERVKAGVPLLGICLGMQLLFTEGEEGDAERNATPGLALIDGRITKFPQDVMVPHVGWNQVNISNSHPVFDHIDGEYFYFVHSYRAELDQLSEDVLIGQTSYYESFPSIVGQDNILGVQFHPEKSSHAGLSILKVFGGMMG